VYPKQQQVHPTPQDLENLRRRNNPTMMERVSDILNPFNWFG